jgi:hypothetical protein
MLVLDVREGASEAFGALKTIVFFTDRYQSDNRGNYCNQSEPVAVPVGSLPSNFKILKFEFKKRKMLEKFIKNSSRFTECTDWATLPISLFHVVFCWNCIICNQLSEYLNFVRYFAFPNVLVTIASIIFCKVVIH